MKRLLGVIRVIFLLVVSCTACFCTFFTRWCIQAQSWAIFCLSGFETPILNHFITGSNNKLKHAFAFNWNRLV